jgi:hypothetical protein
MNEYAVITNVIKRIMNIELLNKFLTKQIMFFFLRSHEGMSTGGDGSSGGGLGGVQGGRNTPPHGSPTPIDKATLKVHLPNGAQACTFFI